MKRFLGVILLSVTALVNYGQKADPSDQFYLLNKDWKIVADSKDAEYLLHRTKVSDTAWALDTYHYFGPRVSHLSFRDEALTIPNGSHFFYDSVGFLDSTGAIINGLQEGEWRFYKQRDLLRVKKYLDGELVESREVTKNRSVQRKDTIDAQESSFKGGIAKWQRYLKNTLQYPKRAMDSYIRGEVIVIFTTDEDGGAVEPGIFRSREYSLDEEALRVVQKSPKWIPSMKDGHPTRAYKMQRIIFDF